MLRSRNARGFSQDSLPTVACVWSLRMNRDNGSILQEQMLEVTIILRIANEMRPKCIIENDYLLQWRVSTFVLNVQKKKSVSATYCHHGVSVFSELVAIFFFVVCFDGEVFHWPWSRTQILDTLSKKL